MKKENEYDITKNLLNTIRESKTPNWGKKRRPVIKEEKEDKESDDEESIAITDDPKFGTNALQNQIDSFKEAVNGGAKFAASKDGDSKSSPLVFFPKTGNLVFSGSIPSMSGLKFQFSLNDVTGAPYIFVDGLALTEDVISTLNKLYGYYKNWKEEWFAAGDLLDKLKKPKED